MAGSVVSIAETGSTNADLLADIDWPEGRWLRADRQTAGRGRLGRGWSSPMGNLHASTVVALNPGDPPAAGLALLAGVALAEALSLFVPAGAPLMLKWPNDLLLNGAKLAGVLLERSGERVVVGLGVNLAHAPILPERPTTSLAEIAPPPAPEVLADVVADRFSTWLARWRREGIGPVRSAWLSRAHPIGTAITVSESGDTGLFDGLAEDGALRLRRANGSIAVVRAGDVRVAA